MKKNILFILPDTEMGGAERQAVLLAKSLCEEYEVDFLCFHFDNHQYKVQEALIDSNVNTFVKESIYPRNSLSKICRLIQLALFCLNRNYYATFPYLYEMNLNVGLLRRFHILRSKKAVWNQRDEGFNGNLNKLNKIALSTYEIFISNSLGGCRFLECKLKVPHGRIHYIRNGVAIHSSVTRDVWRKNNNIGNDEFVACMLANIQCNKDHITVVNAVKLLVDEGLPMKMLFVGYSGDTLEIVRRCIRENKLEDNIVIFGATQDIGALLNAVDVSILSSPSEGLSNTMLESMIMKTPFIGTRIDGITNILGIDYRLLFDFGNEAQLAECIKYVIFNRELVKQLVDKNYELIIHDFSIDRMKNETLTVLE